MFLCFPEVAPSLKSRRPFLGLSTLCISYRSSSPSFSGGANPGLGFSEGKPRSQLRLSHLLGEDKAVEGSALQSLSVLQRTEEVGGSGMFLATTKAAGGAKCELETQTIFLIDPEIKQAKSGKELRH